MPDLDIHIDHTGEERRLGLLPPTPACRLVRAASRPLSAITTIIPKAQWKPVDYLNDLPDELHLNQLQYGRCVAGSCAGSNAMMRWFRSGRILIASMAWIYDCINGGSDNGAVITDAQRVMLATGAPPVSAYTTEQLFKVPKMPSGVPVLKEDEAILIDTPEDIATALISLGGFPQIGINVTNDMEKFTAGGVAWRGRAPGGQANHSVFAGAVGTVDGLDCFKIQMGWGPDWGPLGDGTCWIPYNSIFDGGWLHLSTKDSDDVPPAPA